jgi:hypothetical protein
MKAGAALPEPVKVDFAKAPHYYVYNATCISAIRSELIAAFNKPASGLVRPVADETALKSTPAQWGIDYWDAAMKSLKFLRMQWAGKLPPPAQYDIAWRKPGFIDACNGRAEGGSFAGGGALRKLPCASA